MKLESRDGEGQRSLNTSVNESEKQIERRKDLRKMGSARKNLGGAPRFLRRGRRRNKSQEETWRGVRTNGPEDGLFKPSNNK